MRFKPTFSSRVLRAFLIGLPGILVLPMTLAAPEGVPAALLLVNPLILLLLASLAGAWAAPKVGLRSAMVLGDRLDTRTIARFGCAGVAAGLAISMADHLSAPVWATAEVPSLLQDRTLPDLLTGVLYGGLTEEVMLRWGFMSLLAVGMLRLVSGARAIWSAALIAALAFAAMHLPAVMLEAGSLTMPLIARTMLWNTVLGLLFGLAFMRGGLESAIGTHVGFHVGVAALAAALGA